MKIRVLEKQRRKQVIKHVYFNFKRVKSAVYLKLGDDHFLIHFYFQLRNKNFSQIQKGNKKLIGKLLLKSNTK